MSRNAADPLSVLAARLRESSVARTCVCGKPTGHVGWLVCIVADLPPAKTQQED